MKNIILAVTLTLSISGCAVVATVQKYWPRDHDPVMFETLVVIEQELDAIDCKNPDWTRVQYEAKKLDRYATLRNDPQRENLQGLNKHLEKLSSNKNPVFCDLGKKTGKQRIEAAFNAWKGR